MDLVVLLQGILATAASMAVGFLWYSEVLFVRSWWRHTFPGIAFGDTRAFKNATNHPLYLTLFSTIIQNAILVCVVNFIYPLVSDASPEYSGLKFPLVLGLVVSGLSAATAFPHYVYSKKPFPLYLICVGHDATQATVAIFAIYFSYAVGKN